jgi:hypothetical protein
VDERGHEQHEAEPVKGDEIDEAIDAVVRQIMRTEPPAGLRARVMGQLSAPARRPVLTLPRLAMTTAFAVCVVVGFVVTRDGRAPVAEPAGTAAVASHATPLPPTAAPVPPQRQQNMPRLVTAARPASLPTRPSEEERLVSAMSIEEPALAVAIAPLRPMTVITATPLESSPVRITELAIPPLEMDPVRVDPLPSPPR